MQKLAKRTLAFLLVVCALFGLVAVPAAATDGEPTEATAKTYTYDFTMLANKTNTHDFSTDEARTQNVFWGHNTGMFFGMGNTNYLDISASAGRTVNGFYNNGVSSFEFGSGENTVTYTTNLDLNWMVLDSKTDSTTGVTVEFPDGVIATNNATPDYCLQGGYHYNNYKVSGAAAATTKQNFNGLSYFHRVLDETSYNTNTDKSFKSFKYTDIPGGWVSIKIKAPEVGNYAVQMGHSVFTNGAKQASVYLLPGVVTDKAVIEAAIANGTGKLDGTVNFLKAGIKTHEAAAAPADLGNFAISQPAEEYTVIVTTDVSSTGSTTEGGARTFIDSLTFTQLGESEVLSGEEKTYDFRLQNTYGKDEFPEQSDLKTTEIQDKVDAKYAETGWTFLGSTFGTQQIRNNYLYFLTGGSKTAPNYIAMKLKSPGEGNFNLDLNCYSMTYSGGATGGNIYTYTKPLPLDVFIVKLTEDMDENNPATYLEEATLVGTFETELQSDLEPYSRLTDNVGVYEFEEGAEYIVYLRRVARDLDHNGNNQTSDAEEVYITNNTYPCYMKATPMPATVATIGEDVIPAEDKTYSTAMGTAAGLGKYMYQLAKDGAVVNVMDKDGVTLTDYTGATLSSASGQTGFRYFRANKALTTTAMPANTYAYNADLINKNIELYNSGDMDWRFLDYLSNGGDARYDANNLTIYTMKGAKEAHQGKVGNTVAFLIRSPGEGNFDFSMKMSCQIAAGYTTANLWLNAYLVKVEGDVTVDTFRDHKPETPVGQFAEDYFHTGASSVLSVVPLTVKGEGVTEEKVSLYFEEGADYILYLEAHENADTLKETVAEGEVGYYSAANLYPAAMIFECTDEASTQQTFTTLTAAIDAAEAGETIKLQENVLLSNVELPENVTLDLNGHTLTTGNFSTFLGGKIIDSVGTGLLKVLADDVNFLGDNALAANTLPIYDAANTGYRFFEYSYNAWGTDDDSQYDNGVDGAVRFWYQILFKDVAAYELIAAGNSGVQLGIDVNQNGEVVQECTFKYADVSESTWMQDWASAKAAWLWVRIQDAADIEGLSITPVITAGGLDIELAEIESVQQ